MTPFGPDARFSSVRDAAPPVVYPPHRQSGIGSSSRVFEVRCEAVRRVDPRLPFFDAPVPESMLFGLSPHDPVTISIVVTVMISVGVAAAIVPARRASRVDPLVALRYE